MISSTVASKWHLTILSRISSSEHLSMSFSISDLDYI